MTVEVTAWSCFEVTNLFFLKCVAEQATCPKVDSGKILLKVLTPVWKIFEEGWYLRKLAWQSVSYLGHCQAAFLKKWRHKMAAS